MTKNLPRQTVLLVDDVPENIDILGRVLQDYYSVAVAMNGEMALKVARKHLPDIILLDIMMPDMDGYEVCRQLKVDPSTVKIPVIFITTRDESDDETRGFELGAVDYIIKPISPAIVIARVKTHLALYDQNRVLEEKVRKRTAEIHSTRYEIIKRLGVAAEYRDEETGEHIIRMSHYSHLIGIAFGLHIEASELLLQASPMHDVGKIGIPDHILLKSSKLNESEWEIMKTHTTIGAKIIGEHPSEIIRVAREIALTHHEKWDGSGYPQGLYGDRIPLFGRIVALADMFDALSSERPYKKAWTFDESVEEIVKCESTYFDPAVVSAFLNSIPEILKIKEQYSRK